MMPTNINKQDLTDTASLAEVKMALFPAEIKLDSFSFDNLFKNVGRSFLIKPI